MKFGKATVNDDKRKNTINLIVKTMKTFQSPTEFNLGAASSSPCRKRATRNGTGEKKREEVAWRGERTRFLVPGPRAQGHDTQLAANHHLPRPIAHNVIGRQPERKGKASVSKIQRKREMGGHSSYGNR